MKKITKKDIDKNIKAYEKKLTKAYLKNDEKKIESLKQDFQNIVEGYAICHNVAVNIAYISPSQTYQKMEIEILEGSQTELKKLVDKKLAQREKINSEMEG